MPGDFTCTSAISGAATKTVVAGPGSRIAVPLFTSSLSVGCCVDTISLRPKARPGAPVGPPVTTVGELPGAVPPAGGWIGTGAGLGACANRGTATVPSAIFGRTASDVACGGALARAVVGIPDVSDAVTTGVRGGMAVTVGGSSGFAAAGRTAAAEGCGALVAAAGTGVSTAPGFAAPVS